MEKQTASEKELDVQSEQKSKKDGVLSIQFTERVSKLHNTSCGILILVCCRDFFGSIPSIFTHWQLHSELLKNMHNQSGS